MKGLVPLPAPLRSLRVAVSHEWVVSYRGGERVLEAILELFPQAPLYTLVHKKGSCPPSIENRHIVTSFLNAIPGAEKHYPKFLPLMPRAASALKLPEEYDLLITSSHCVIKGMQIGPRTKHLAYVHSPMRYMYDQFDVYFPPGGSFLKRKVAEAIRPGLIRYDLESNKTVQVMLANSRFVAGRIRKHYGRDADILYPFVDLQDFPVSLHANSKEDFSLVVSALTPNKRIDLAIDAFRKNGERLLIVGDGTERQFLQRQAGSNIEFLGNLPREKVIDLMSRAKAFVFPGVEDFGITPLESLAAGTPVVAFRAGGALETLNEDVAEFFDAPSSDAVVKAHAVASQRTWNRNALRARALEFSKEAFQTGLIRSIEKMFAEDSL
jgi:glycosyltransferase involved in cell wall biosynthesis